MSSVIGKYWFGPRLISTRVCRFLINATIKAQLEHPGPHFFRWAYWFQIKGRQLLSRAVQRIQYCLKQLKILLNPTWSPKRAQSWSFIPSAGSTTASVCPKKTNSTTIKPKHRRFRAIELALMHSDPAHVTTWTREEFASCKVNLN